MVKIVKVVSKLSYDEYLIAAGGCVSKEGPDVVNKKQKFVVVGSYHVYKSKQPYRDSRITLYNLKKPIQMDGSKLLQLSDCVFALREVNISDFLEETDY